MHVEYALLDILSIVKAYWVSGLTLYLLIVLLFFSWKISTEKLLIFVGFLVLTISFVFQFGIVDDAYIFMRYADNVMQGHGLVFNPGKRVEGFSSPAWQFLVLMGAWARVDLPLFSLVLGYVVCLICAIVLWKLLLFLMPNSASENNRLRRVAMLWYMFLLLPDVTRWSAQFLGDITLFFLVILVALLIFFNRKVLWDPLLSLIFGIAWLVRPEAGLYFIAFSALFLIEDTLFRHQTFLARRYYKLSVYRFIRMLWLDMLTFLQKRVLRLVKWVVPFGVIVTNYLLWRLWYYGDILPNTYYAKTGQWSIALFQRAVEYLVHLFSSTPYQLIAFFCVLAFFAKPTEKKRRALLLFFFTALLWGSYIFSIGGDWMEFRFVLILLPGIIPALVLGNQVFFDALDRQKQTVSSIILFVLGIILVGRITFPSYTQIITCALLLAGAGFVLVAKRKNLTLPVAFLLFFSFFMSYKALDIALEKHLEPPGPRMLPTQFATAQLLRTYNNKGKDVVIAADAIGMLSFYSRLPTIDMLGLTDKVIARTQIATFGRFAGGHDKGNGRYVLGRQPDYIFPWWRETGFVTTIPITSDKKHFIQKKVAFNSAAELANDEKFWRQYDVASMKMGETYLSYFYRRDMEELKL